MGQFNIPIVFFIFKRIEKSLQILTQISKIKPSKIYLISDEGRNDEEKARVVECRRKVEEMIDWDCTVIKNYAESNKGCYDRIGLGAIWVFQREKKAIFLEDDNMPELSFFKYCEELLELYENNDKVLWICGTNYLEKSRFKNGADYTFTQHMLPCGWASWSDKFIKYYDKDFSGLNDNSLEQIKNKYKNKRLFNRDLSNWMLEKKSLEETGRYFSWDYHMTFSIREYDKYGIIPKYNQIKNIGVDLDSEHGGVTMDNIMTRRFCGMDSVELQFPLKHPREVKTEKSIERKLDKIVLPPQPHRIRNFIRYTIVKLIKKVFNIPDNVSVRERLKFK